MARWLSRRPLFAPVTTDIIAPKGNAGYVIDARGVVARDPYGLCWHTGSYTKADALPGCDLPLCVEPSQAGRRQVRDSTAAASASRR
ncbi:hypothetical protein LP420_08690 [Massilia sp. B-10]|nr:hypothetical protein LP420_08690 [Massilia sp. B-10]